MTAKKDYPIETQIPFALKEAAVKEGAYLKEIPETGEKIWTADTKQKRDRVRSLIENFGIDPEQKTDIRTEEDYYCYDERNNKEQKEEDPDKKEIPFAIHPVTYKDFNWDAVLSEDRWDSLSAVQRIKKYGLPKLESQRIRLLKNLSVKKPGEQFSVVYEDLCEYSEAFRQTYGWDVIKKALEAGKIEDGFNFQSTVNTSTSLPEEAKKLLLYALPVVKREISDDSEPCRDESEEREI